MKPQLCLLLVMNINLLSYSHKNNYVYLILYLSEQHITEGEILEGCEHLLLEQILQNSSPKWLCKCTPCRVSEFLLFNILAHVVLSDFQILVI